MKIIKKCLILSLMFTIGFCFNSIASSVDYVRPVPATEPVTEDISMNYRWIWLSDQICVRTQTTERDNNEDKEWLLRRFEYGVVQSWSGDNSPYRTRETYTGTWSQDENGIWSFKFDDYTIPVGLTKIDGVLYAFTGYGELKDGYEYWNGLKTGADGIVTENSQEFLDYLSMQYLPECYSVSLAE